MSEIDYEALNGHNPHLKTTLAKWTPTFDQATGDWVSGELAFNEAHVSSELELALKIFRYAFEPEQREFAFWWFASLVWHEDAGLLPKREFEWNDWSDQQIKEYCRESQVAVGGSSNAAKSRTIAAFAIACWMCDPSNTLVLVTSTSIKDSKRRIWGAIDALLYPLIKAGLAPTKLRADGSAPYNRPDGSITDSAGLFIIAGAKGQDRDKLGRYIGIKAGPEIKNLPDGRRIVRPRLIIAADELSELSPSINEAIINWKSQEPLIVGLSNPSGKWNPFGEFAEPAGGWTQYEDHELLEMRTWRTKRGGVYLRFDAYDSPNVKEGRVIFDYLPTQKTIEDGIEEYGAGSVGFLRFIRASFFDSGAAEGVYSMPEFVKGGALDSPEPEWREHPKVVTLAATDPAESNEGDSYPLMRAKVGRLKDGRTALWFFPEVEYLHSDDTKKAVPRAFQIAEQFTEKCKSWGVVPEGFAIDATMGQWGDIAVDVFGHGIHQVSSNGSATERPLWGGQAEAEADQTNRDRYIDRVAEMWFAPKALLREGLLLNIPRKAVDQMIMRGFSYGKGGRGIRVGVEPKKDFRRRTGGQSPDEADTVFLLIDLAIERHGLRPEKAPDPAAVRPGYPRDPVSAMLDFMINPTGTFATPLGYFDMAGRNDQAFLQ